MVHAFAMVKTGTGKSETLLSDIRSLESVDDAHIVAGEFDIIVEVDAPEVYDVFRAVSTGIQKMEGVTDTRTYIGLD